MAPSSSQPNKALHIALWVVQVLLAVMFAGSGFMKATTAAEELVKVMPWAEGNGIWMARVAGVSEILGALGLILPSATRIQPKLTGLAGVGLATVMVLAAGLHITRGEFGYLLPNAVLGGLAAFVAYGRLKAAPIAPKA